MAKDQAYYKAEEKIKAALQSGATELDLRNMKLTELPESIGQLTQLTKLYLSSNQLVVLPDSLGQLTQLTFLNLSNNKLTSLPDSLGQLAQLTFLEISQNLLDILPNWLGDLKNLEKLYIGGNKVKRIDEIWQVKNLQLLGLFDLQITDLPPEIANLTNLTTLHISGNPIKNLPKEIFSLSKLTHISIGEGDSYLPKELWELRNLKTLSLHRRGLKKFPVEVMQLTNLTDLNLFHNGISDIPVEVLQLKDLTNITLEENPLDSELAEAYKQGFEGVKAYLRARKKGEILLNEAKLILVGEGEVGKTCLMDALLDKEWQEHPSTHGIEIQQIKATHLIQKPDKSNNWNRKEKIITLNAWDFGGQRVYRPTHQLFFSSPAVYLVVWKPREGSQQGLVKEWIQLIKRREPSAKIIVVATHGGPQQRLPDIDRQEIWELFGKKSVIDFLWVDNKPDENGERKGVQELKAAIAQVAADLPEVGRSVPKSFTDVRAALQATKAAYLPLEKVREICRAHNMDDEIANLFIAISHQLGHLTHYATDPTLRHIVILRPDWLATAMSYVLDDLDTRNAHGLVKFSRLSHLWNDPARPVETRYDEPLHRIFLRLMERFDLSYRVAGISPADDSNPTSLIAQLVPDTTPEDSVLAKAWTPEPAQGDRQQTQICRIVDAQSGQSANAEGLFYQLIVRLHRYSLGRVHYDDSVHWQRGLILDADYNGRALLRHVGNDIHITVRAAYPQGFLSTLTDEVRYLIDKLWEGLRCEVTVPCLNPNPCKGLFEVSKLIENKKRGRPEMPCTICNEWQDIDCLLSNAPASTQLISEDMLYAKFIELEKEISSIRPTLESQHKEVVGKFAEVRTEIQELFSQAESNLNFMLQALADEAKEGPRLFSLVPVYRDKFDPRGWATARFQLTLWCEHSHLPLTALNEDKTIGVYQFDLTREWVKKYSPLVKAFTITLKSFLPVAFAAAKLAIDATVYKDIENELDFSKACIDALISESEGIGGLFVEGAIGDEPTGLPLGKRLNVQDGNLREFHALLNKVDPSRKYGNLHKVTDKQQKFLWVHEKFAGEY